MVALPAFQQAGAIIPSVNQKRDKGTGCSGAAANEKEDQQNGDRDTQEPEEYPADFAFLAFAIVTFASLLQIEFHGTTSEPGQPVEMGFDAGVERRRAGR